MYDNENEFFSLKLEKNCNVIITFCYMYNKVKKLLKIYLFQVLLKFHKFKVK